MTASGMKIAGVHTLRHARHILAVVCGLGMGVMAALFLVINVIADFWGPGTVGLPATIPELSDRFTVFTPFQMTYSISVSMLTLFHVFWTVLFWDGCHKRNITKTWWFGIFFVVFSHYATTALASLNWFLSPRGYLSLSYHLSCTLVGILLFLGMLHLVNLRMCWTYVWRTSAFLSNHGAYYFQSFGNRSKYQALVMSAQGVLLVLNALISFYVMGGNWPMLKHTTKLAFSRAFGGRCC
ncbi:unnamed protein product, partial [Gongylonema pulchrum]|uniref:Gamma-secretase subunit Aph-1 n=1 Tax=Gongylonema pulchrum TaxID=637853 RepID=A0A183DAP0_9BILA